MPDLWSEWRDHDGGPCPRPNQYLRVMFEDGDTMEGWTWPGNGELSCWEWDRSSIPGCPVRCSQIVAWQERLEPPQIVSHETERPLSESAGAS